MAEVTVPHRCESARPFVSRLVVDARCVNNVYGGPATQLPRFGS